MTVVLAATDLSARSDRAIERAIERAAALGGRVVVAHVVDDSLPRAVLAQLREAAETQVDACRRCVNGGVEIELRMLEGQAHRNLVMLAYDLEAAALVMGIHRNASGPGAMVGGTVERLVKAGPCPILLARDPVAGPYQKAVVAVDFSPAAKRALRATMDLAGEAELVCAHAYHVPFGGFHSGDEARQAAEAEHMHELMAFIEDEVERRIRAGLPTPKITPVNRHGEPHQVLRKVVEAEQPQLLVIGSHGRTGLARMVLGSVAETILSHPPCDVLTVRAN